MPAISLAYPVIDLAATGENIRRLRQQQGLSVRDLQAFFGFEEPRAIYKWQSGQTLPSVDNLYALSAVLQVPMERILVCAGDSPPIGHSERQAAACRPLFLHFLPCGSRGTGDSLGLFGPFCLGADAPAAGRKSPLRGPL